MGVVLPDAQPLLTVETTELDPDKADEPEPEAPVPEPLGIGAPDAGLLLETPPEADVPEPAGASVPVVAVESPGFGAISEPEITEIVGAAEPAPAELEPPDTSEAAELVVQE